MATAESIPGAGASIRGRTRPCLANSKHTDALLDMHSTLGRASAGKHGNWTTEGDLRGFERQLLVEIASPTNTETAYRGDPNE